MIGEPDMNIPTTPYDTTPAGCADRLQKLLDTPPLKITLEGGVMGGPFSQENPLILLIERGEVEEVIRHLRSK